MSDRFVELLGACWAAAYQQGKDGRTYDDKDGTAQIAESNICHFVDSLRLSLSTARADGMEEAARIADAAKEMRERLFSETESVANAARAVQAEDIASAIRKAKESKG